MKAAELNSRIRYRHHIHVLDARDGADFRDGHIPGAVHAPPWKVLLRLAALPENRDVPLVVTSEQGERTQTLMALLRILGYQSVQPLEGHMVSWRRSGLKLER